MQLVVRRDRHVPTREIDVAEGAARAVVALLADERSLPGGPWHEDVAHWSDERIRKLVRRADGKRWDDVQDLDGVTITQPGPVGYAAAAVRAFVPAPVTPLPKALDKLQVSGTQFETSGQSLVADALVTIEVSPLVAMTSGKLAAQCGHAAQLAWLAMGPNDRERWRDDGFRIRVERPDQKSWRTTERPVSVVDSGFTEFDGPTETTRATW
ncbi:peptidyl-tRNA hydrolase [Raineyella fluvialis]|uniref:Peptidyl-tRNA hydrolase n=1 Tax=Raineyella fluvialis TaxID=2662261 RepID=A0A5Q2FKK9_9ACTN|nr:peptidyl-tRNA hydrolase [Raineyella fluvialis]QGF25195.1 peptidyl-tRNA hydrolase [Raineyella fluvialis]